MKIIIVGMPGAGKTTIGKKLSNKYNFRFIDSDEYIEEKYRMSINSIFTKIGENGFRELEQKAIDEILSYENIIFSTGGGTPCFFDNMKKLNENGITIYLELDYKTISNRLFNSKKNRPLLNNKSNSEVEEYVISTLEKRSIYYKQAKYIINPLHSNVYDFFEDLISKQTI